MKPARTIYGGKTMSTDSVDIVAAIRGLFVRAIVCAGFLTFFVSLLYLVVPLFMLQIYDRVLRSESLETLTVLGTIALIGLALLGVLDFIRSRANQIVGNAMVARLDMPVLRAAVDGIAQGGKEVAAQAIHDLNELRAFVAGQTLITALELVWTPLFLVVAFLLHPAFLVLGVVTATLMVAIGLVSHLATRQPLSSASNAMSGTYSELGTTVHNAEVIEAMGMLRPVTERWRANHQRMTAHLDRGEGTGKAFSSLGRSVRLVAQIATLSLGAYLVIHRQITPGAMIAGNILIGRLLNPFERAVGGWRQALFAAAAFKRLRDLLADRDATPRTMTLPRPDARVVVDRLTYVPPGRNRPILRNVSFTVEPGEVVGVIGPSAAGKSTLARHLVGVVKPTGGGVYLDGHSTYLWERENFGGYVGYLPQNLAILEGTVRQNIARMTDADPHRVVEAARNAGIHDAIGRLPHGYETRVGDVGYLLSGGQRQRLALARALFGNPVLLVLDEPNSSLDYEGEIALDRAIGDAKVRGAAIVIIAHRPSAVAQADKLLLLRDGVVEQYGPAADVLGSRQVSALAGSSPDVRRRPRLVVENE